MSASVIPATFYSVASPINGFSSQHDHKSLSVMRKMAQGAGSALLMFAGADSMTSSAAAAAAGEPHLVDFSSIDGIAQSLLTGGLTGPAQLIAAVFLFLVAGKCIARFVGLIAVSAILILYMKGVGVADMWQFVEHFAERTTAAVSAFQTAQVG